MFVYRKNFLEAKHVTNHQKIAMKAGVTEVDYEPQTEGGYATTTPQDFELLRNDPSYATARLYKVKHLLIAAMTSSLCCVVFG